MNGSEIPNSIAVKNANPTQTPIQVTCADAVQTVIQRDAQDNPPATHSVLNNWVARSHPGLIELPKFIPQIDPWLQNRPSHGRHLFIDGNAQKCPDCEPRKWFRTGEAMSSRQRNDRKNLEAFLLVVFLALNNPSPETSKEVHNAFEQVTRILRRYVALILASRHVPNAWVVAEDIVQEFWLRLLTRDLARRFDEQQSTLRAPYLFGILRNVISEVLRRLKLGRVESLAIDIPDLAPNAEEAAEMRELQEDVSVAISRLRPTLAAAIRERYWPDTTLPATTDRTTPTQYVHTFRAKQELRFELQGRYGVAE